MATWVSLSAAMLRAANSPAFGLRQKVTSVSRAVLLLGARNTISLVTGLVLRQVMSPKGAPKGKLNLEVFWDNTADTALLCSFLAKHFRWIAPDHGHLLGLFHDCGIPLMMQRFPNYADVLRLGQVGVQEIAVSLEDQYFKTNHAVIGYIMARSWCLPDDLRKVILHHHDGDVFTRSTDVSVSRAVALLSLAEHLSCLFKQEDDSAVWAKIAEPLMEVLGVNDDDVTELGKDAVDILSTSVA